MSRSIIIILVLSGYVFTAPQPTLAITGNDIIALKKAGISDQTIELIVKEKVVETAVFSIDEIVNMKKAGVGEKTLQLLVKEGSSGADAGHIVYGRSTQSLRRISSQDIIYLKNNGVSDSVILAVIETTKSCDENERNRAWRMLENMNLWINSSSGRRR